VQPSWRFLPVAAGAATARWGSIQKGLEREGEHAYIPSPLAPVRDFHNIAWFGLAGPGQLWAELTGVGFDI
jgi:hypothetical protein